MSKSRGNLVFVSALRREGHDPMAIRLALLGHRYRSDWEWTGRDLDRAEERLARWREAVDRTSGPDATAVLEGVRRHLADDLDAPGALAVVDRWAEQTRLDGADGGGASGDEAAPRLVAATVDALLGVAL
jgi:L-cysteine:1D-myo-inositol 2-amino-2-deoxy-alpha-D-glucopyranoside ligase